MGSNYLAVDPVSLLLNTNAPYPCMIFLVACNNHNALLLALPTKGKDIVVFRFIIEYYCSLRDFGPY
jgi:hypothetical protein